MELTDVRVTQDMAQGRAVVNMVMNLLVPKSAGSLLTSCRSPSILRTVLYKLPTGVLHFSFL